MPGKWDGKSRIPTKKYKDNYNRIFNVKNTQKNIKVKNRLFMTATERLFRGNEDEYLSMDDPRDYGNIIYELNFKETIASQLLIKF